MSTNLGDLCQQINLPVASAIDFLRKHDYNVMPSSGDFILNNEQYKLLTRHFGIPKILILRWTEDAFTDNPAQNRAYINSHGWNDLRNDILLELPDRYVFLSKNQNRSELNFWNVAYFLEKCADCIDGRYLIRQINCKPSGTIPIIPYIGAQTGMKKTDDGIKIFQPNPSISSLHIATVGKIDLDSINQSTRPRKKTKEERKDERKMNKSQEIAAPNNVPASNDADSQEMIKEVWQKFVEIQEQLVRQRCMPISIDPDSVEIIGNKLSVVVDETPDELKLATILKNRLGIEHFYENDGHIMIEESIWVNLSQSELSQIVKDLSECYLELDTTPTVSVAIDYGKQLNSSENLSISELRELEDNLKESDLVNGSINDTVAFISKISFLNEDYMNHISQGHYHKYEAKKKNGTVHVTERLEYLNQYISNENLKRLSYLGISLKQYTIIFKVGDKIANNELKDCFDFYFPNTDTFEFKRTFNEKHPFIENFLDEINSNITAFLTEATEYCRQEDITIDVQFAYTFSNYMARKAKFEEVREYVANLEGYSFNVDNGVIGIDFKWKDQNILDIISDLERAIPFIKVNVFPNHRFKCKISTSFVDYSSLKKLLEERYDVISVVDDSTNHVVKIDLPYKDSSLYDVIADRLVGDIHASGISFSMIRVIEKPKDKVKLNIRYNGETRIEELEDRIGEMRKADFGFSLGESTVTFGKLLKVSYPNLTFDLNVDESLRDQIVEAFESKAITTIEPILTGELEKISRLKNTFSMAFSGENLPNSNMQRFIFDSSEARGISDVDLILRKDGSVYSDLSRHLLNPHINDSQKEAIIKALFADDLAVIQGPPGTGKSTAIAELIWQLVRRGLQQGNKRERILLTSETNLAVDNAIARIVNPKSNIVKPIRFGDDEKLESEGLQFSLDLMKKWVEEGDSCLSIEGSDENDCDTVTKVPLILKNWLDNIATRSFYGIKDNDDENIIGRWRSYLNNPKGPLRELVYKKYLDHANVVGATCSSIGDKRAGDKEFNGFTSFFHSYCEVFRKKKGSSKIEFTSVIQDESSKATPAELVLPFVYGDRAIVIGDHRQLPPMLDQEEFQDTLEYALQKAKDEKERSAISELIEYVRNHFKEMEISHFQHLYERIDDSLKGTFNLQYRMHPDINEVIEQFYREDGGLTCGLDSREVNDKDMINPASRYHGLDIPGVIGHNTHVLFIDTDSPEMLDGTSRVNYGEVETIDKLLTRFENSVSFQKYLKKFTKEEDKQIGIISFYGKQIRQLRSVATQHSSLPIRVSTVDRFQGMERNIVIVSMVRSHIIQSAKGQQPDWNRYPESGFPRQYSLGFAQSPNRLNVALSRAKRLLVIVGNRQLFSKLDIYQRLFSTIEANPNDKIIKQNEL